MNKNKMLSKRKAKIQLLLLSVIVLFLVQVVNIVPLARGFDPETTVVKANWLYVSPGSFSDTSPHSWENEITIQTGGEDLLEFENLGIVSEETGDTQVVYKARAKFGFEATAHTSVDYRDFFPNVNLGAVQEEWFFSVQHCYSITDNTYDAYNVKWNYVDFGSISQWHDYMGNIPITVGIKELTGTRGEIEINGVTITVPEYIPNTLQTQVTNLRSGIVGDYEDIFTNVNDVEGGDVSFKVFDEISDRDQYVISFLEDYEIGWKMGSVERGQTLQQSMVDGAQVGATFHNQFPATNRFYTFPLNTKIQPEVYQHIQYNTLKSAGITVWHYWYPDGTIEFFHDPATRTVQRVCGVHTTNYFLHWDFTVDVEFYATIPSTAELTESILNDPYLKAGDMIWDTSPWDEEDVVIVILPTPDPVWLTDLFSWVGIIVGLVFLAIGVYIFIQVGVPLLKVYALSKKVRRKTNEY